MKVKEVAIPKVDEVPNAGGPRAAVGEGQAAHALESTDAVGLANETNGRVTITGKANDVQDAEGEEQEEEMVVEEEAERVGPLYRWGTEEVQLIVSVEEAMNNVFQVNVQQEAARYLGGDDGHTARVDGDGSGGGGGGGTVRMRRPTRTATAPVGTTSFAIDAMVTRGLSNMVDPALDPAGGGSNQPLEIRRRLPLDHCKADK